MDHLRLAGKSDAEQRQALGDIIVSEPVLVAVLAGCRELGLNDCWLVSGAIYNVVWNRLTGRPAFNGVKDIDVIYFDGSDLSYEAEDVEIKRADTLFAGLPVPVELRNQARVHLWYEQKFGRPFAPLTSATGSLYRYASKTHAIAVRYGPGETLELFAPFGLNDVFSFRITPNPAGDNRATHEAKGARAKQHWPELEVVAWPDA